MSRYHTANTSGSKSRFIEMFGTPENNHKSFPLTTIGRIVETVNYGTSKPASNDGKFKYLRMNNISYEGQLDLSDCKTITLDPEIDADCFVKKGDLLFNRTNTKELVGKTCVYNLDYPMVIAGYIIKVKLQKGYLSEYVSGYLNSEYGKGLLRKMAKGAVHQANINAQELKSIRVLDVPYDLQLKYLRLLQQVDKSGYFN